MNYAESVAKFQPRVAATLGQCIPPNCYYAESVGEMGAQGFSRTLSEFMSSWTWNPRVAATLG